MHQLWPLACSEATHTKVFWDLANSVRPLINPSDKTEVLQMKHYTSIKGIALSSQFSNHNGSVCRVLTQTHSPKQEPPGLASAEAVTLPNTQEKTYLTKQKCNKNTQMNTHQKPPPQKQ